MGVPGFNTWFARNHRHAYVSYFNRSWDHVYIDMASILHSTMKTASNLSQFHKQLFARLDSIMALSSPRKSVMFALDGPAPLAKLLTQRKRRARESIKSGAASQPLKVAAPVARPSAQAMPTGFTLSSTAAAQLNLTKQSYATATAQQMAGAQDGRAFSPAASRFKNRTRKRGLSTIGLTPGTPLMAEIERSLEFYICQRLQKWKHVEFELSGATVQGEGEIKIMKRINAAAHSNGSHVIVGNDSDIILMSLLSPARQLYILAQQTKGRMDKYSCISFDALSMLQSSDVLGAAVGQSRKADFTGLNMDLVLVAMIAKGNDYLPAVRGIVGTADSFTLWKNYLGLRQSPQWVNQVLVIVDQESQTASLNSDLLIELLRSNPSEPRDRVTVAANLLPADAEHYAQGLVWVLNMYLSGECSNYRWTHDNEAPSLPQLVKALKMLATSSQAAAQDGQNKGALLPSVCALALLPRSARKYMPEALQPLMDQDSPVADVFESCGVCDQLTANNTRVTNEYMKLYGALQTANDLRPTTGRGAQRRYSSESEESVSQVSAQGTVSGTQDADLSDEDAGVALTGLQSPDDQPRASNSAEDDLEPAAILSESDDTTELSDFDVGGSGTEDDLHSADPAALHDADVQQMQQRTSALRGQINSLRQKRQAHLSSAHPYAPFPIERLEQAVASVPQDALTPEQQELGRFGQSHMFTWAKRGTAAKHFSPQCPAGMRPVTSTANIVRKSIEERHQPAPPANTAIIANRQQVSVQSYMQQHIHSHSQQPPLVRSELQRQAGRQHAAARQLSSKFKHMAHLPLNYPGGLCFQHGVVRRAPTSCSMLTRTTIRRYSFMP